MAGYVSMKDLQEQIDIHAIEKSARAQWEQEQRKRQFVEWLIVKSLPIGVFIMAVIFYLLSAPHTAGILNIITPGFGMVAPLGFELGILIIAAFRERGWKNQLSAGILYTLLTMAILINIAGGFIAVTEYASQQAGQDSIATSTLLDILGRWQFLPARYQLVLLLAIPLGAVIPFIAKLIGEILIRIAFGVLKVDKLNPDERWARDAHKVMTGALLQAAMRLGAGVKTAGNWASSVSDQMYLYKESSDLHRSPIKAVGKSSGMTLDQPARTMGFLAEQTVPRQSQSPFLSAENVDLEPGRAENDQKDSPSPRLSKKAVAAWLETRPEHHQKSNRQISRLYMLDTFGIDSDSGHKTVERVKHDLGI